MPTIRKKDIPWQKFNSGISTHIDNLCESMDFDRLIDNLTLRSVEIIDEDLAKTDRTHNIYT